MESHCYFETIESKKRNSLILKNIFHLNHRDPTKPLSVFLVKSGSSGNHLLFRYPFDVPLHHSFTEATNKGKGQHLHRNNSFKDGPSRNGQQPSRTGVPQQQQLQQQVMTTSDHFSTVGTIQDVDKISKYGLNDTITYSRDKLTAVIKSINAGVASEQEQELFPPVLTAPTIPESAIVSDNDYYRGDEGSGDVNLNVDPLIMQVVNLSDNVLTDLFAVKQGLCGQKFEVKINNIRFVGHPIYITSPNEITTLNIVFALKASSSHDIVNCYHELSHRLSIALLTEESRNRYLSNETENMLKLHKFEEHHDNYDDEYDDEVMNINKGCSNNVQMGGGGVKHFGTIIEPNVEFNRKRFKIECLTNILEQNQLAAILRRVFDDIIMKGTTSVLVNESSLISFCLPQKVHQLLRSTNHYLNPSSLATIGPSEITKALKLLKPFHGILLLNDYSSASASAFGDKNNGLNMMSDTIKIVTKIKPTKTLLELSKDTNVSMAKIFHVVSSLVYWGKGLIIYPICLNNVYSVHPLANTSINSSLISDFKNLFNKLTSNGQNQLMMVNEKQSNKFAVDDEKNGGHLLQFLSLFNQGIKVKELLIKTGFTNNLLINLLIWCLKRCLLLQIHTYITYFNPDDDQDDEDNVFQSGSPINFNTSLNYDDVNDEEEEGFNENKNESNNREDKTRKINLGNYIEIKNHGTATDPSIKSSDIKSVLDSDQIYNLSIKENESIARVAIENNVSIESLQLFLRIKHYFDGSRHVEDIMFHEQITRKSINKILHSFNQLLCTSQCEDRAVAQLCPYFQQSF